MFWLGVAIGVSAMLTPSILVVGVLWFTQTAIERKEEKNVSDRNTNFLHNRNNVVRLDSYRNR